VNALALEAVPAGVVTLIGPVVAPIGTVAEIDVEELTEKLALVPLKRTAVASVKFVPLIVTAVMTGRPLVGVKLVIVGGLAATVNALALETVPAGVVTLIGPAVAPLGTAVAIVVTELTVKLALTPLKVTAVAPVKFVPVIVTVVSTGALVGMKLVIDGGGSTANAIVQLPDREPVSHQKSVFPSPSASPARH
jgi:hypothetical protein